MLKEQVITVFHLYCGSGAGALGFKQARDVFNGIQGRFETLGGIDVDPLACQDFEYLTGVKATCMDLFERRDYVAFHGKDPGPNWREATPSDIKVAAQGKVPNVVFLSPPCKGLSGLLPQEAADTDKYQALNRLTIRGIFLTLEAFRDDLPAFILLENVPRIAGKRGKKLLHTIRGMLESYGYVVDGRAHDCGVVGGLAQHRKRYLLMARNPAKIPVFLYHPPIQRVKAIGEVIGPLPLPDDLDNAGIMHKLPRLQWKTWVRLALIKAGGDWRDLETINPEEYRLDYVPRGGGPYGVLEWNKPGCTVIGNAGVKGSNAASISDPRLNPRDSRHASVYQIQKWDNPAGVITGSRFGSGAQAISDPRTNFKESAHHAIYKVTRWTDSSATVTGANGPNNGALSIEDPRLGCSPRSGTMGVQSWDQPAKTIIASGDVHAGSSAIADPRIPADTDRLDPPPVIIALDGCWHRPLTTLELAILQGLPLMVNGKPLKLAGKSDSSWRERIGNMVPVGAAKAIGEVILHAILVASEGYTWDMSANDIWVSPNVVDLTNNLSLVDA